MTTEAPPKTVDSKISDFLYRQIIFLNQESSYSKAALAKLRHAVGKPREETPDIWDITLLDAPAGEQAGVAIHTALTLYALHRQGKTECVSDGKTGFGTAIASLSSKDQNNESAIKRRFNAVSTASDFTELAHHARGLVQLLKAKDIKLNYPRFASDLFFFQLPNHAGCIRLKWGEQFYRNFVKSDSDETKTEGTDEQ